MSILGDILGRIFHPHATQATTAATATATPSPSVGGAASVGAPTAVAEVDVEADLDRRAKQSSQKLNWRTSIVDMMKLLDLDSSLESRRELAKELHYTGDTNDTATMNIWLHKQVIQKIAENGGKVPASLKD